MTTHPSFPRLVQAFFTERLLQQRQASTETIAGYRDCFRLLLRFAAQRLKQAPSSLSLDDLDAPFIGEFLDHLEKERSNMQGPETHAWRQSIPSFDTFRSRSQVASTCVAGYWQFPASGTNGD